MNKKKKKKILFFIFLLLIIFSGVIFFYRASLFNFSKVADIKSFKNKKKGNKNHEKSLKHFEFGRLFMQQEKYIKAIEEFSKVKKSSSMYGKALGSLGNIYYKMGNLKNASIHWSALLKIDPENLIIKTMLKNINSGNKEKIHLNNSKKGDKTNSWMKKFIEADKYIKEKKFNLAKEILKKIIQDGHKNFKIFFSLGTVYRELKDLDNVILNWTEALKQSPQDKMIKGLLSRVKKIQLIKKDLKKIRELIKEDMKNWKLHLKLAQTLDTLNKLSSHERENNGMENIINELEIVLWLNPSHIETYLPLINMLEEEDDYENAIKYTKKIVKLQLNVASYKKRLNLLIEFNKLKKNSLKTISSDIKSFIKGEMIHIPEGEFTMGTNDDSIGIRLNEKPEHIVFLKDFLIDKYEVTNIYFKNFMEQKESKIFGEIGYKYYPVTNVTWFNAKDYCNWIGKRLPTEEEWEKSARGTEKRKFPWGNDFNKNLSNTRFSGFMKSTLVGGYRNGVSPYGIHDLSGNIQEWTNSWYLPYNKKKIETDENKKLYKVLRGGSFLLDPLYSTATSRDFKLPDYKDNTIGFRCAEDG